MFFWTFLRIETQILTNSFTSHIVFKFIKVKESDRNAWEQKRVSWHVLNDYVL